MNAGKSTSLLQYSHNYEQRDLNVLLFTPEVDAKIHDSFIHSRIGLKKPAYVFNEKFDFIDYVYKENKKRVSCILVDEAQFLSPKQVLQLTLVVDKLKIPVLCYGLRSDFRGEPFPGSAYLLAWSDEMTEIKTICKSGKKATMNARLDESGNRVTEGDQISIGLNYEAQARDVFELDKVSPIGYQIPEAN